MSSFALFAALVSPARAEAPIRVLEEAVEVPDGLDPELALASVEDVTRIFALYDPVVPRVPGVTIDLGKEVLSEGSPSVLQLPVSGNVFGKEVTEVARVTASTHVTTCGDGEGRTIVLSFDDSSYNIERRIDRIEITACLTADGDGHRVIATGRMYAGFRPEDPALNAFTESIGAKAIQNAFLRQVPPIVQAVEAHWNDLPRTPEGAVAAR